MVAQALRCQRGQRALARSRRPVDADHRDVGCARLGEREQRFKVVRECLGHAFRVQDAHRQAGRIESRQRKTHGHAVVVVSVNGSAVPLHRRRDANEVCAFFNKCPQFAQLAGHGRDAVGFLDAPAGNVAQRGCAVGVERHHGQRHGGVGYVVAVQINGFERPGAARDLQRIGAAFYLGTHQLRGFDKADVPLDRGRANAAYVNAEAGAGAGGDGA